MAVGSIHGTLEMGHMARSCEQGNDLLVPQSAGNLLANRGTVSFWIRHLSIDLK
jgi:hypothetical protein